MAEQAVAIMGESVKAGVMLELDKAFPDIYLYKERVSEPMFPNFFLEQLTVGAKEERKGYWWLNYLLTLRYRPAADAVLESSLQEKLDETGFKLLSGLQNISLGTFLIPFRNPRTEKNSGALFYFCNFQFQVSKPEIEAIKMWHLTIETKLHFERT